MNNTSPTQVGNDRILLGMVLGLLSFWLFAQTIFNVAPAMKTTLGIEETTMNIAVSITALFSGMFIVVCGGLADRLGRLKITRLGFVFSILGSLLVAITPDFSFFTAPILLIGRALQGLSIACIMPATLALLKVYWDSSTRQRAISLWSIGTWGGSGLCSLFGGLMQTHFGWRSIFWVAVVVSILGLLLMKGVPESKAEHKGKLSLDFKGIITFMISMLALQILITQGSRFGWTSPISLGLVLITVMVSYLFFKFERHHHDPFFNFKIFKNRTFSGTVLSNFLLNTAAGMLIVSLQFLQMACGLSTQEAGLLTLGYAFCIIAFIRLGEKLMIHFGSRKPMIWGAITVAISIVLFAQTQLPRDSYVILAGVSYTLFGLGLAFYATPSVSAALSNLPENQSGAGSGIYKMSSSLGSAFGIAMSASIFTAIRLHGGLNIAFIHFEGHEQAIRQAAMVSLSINAILVFMSALVVVLALPKVSNARQ